MATPELTFLSWFFLIQLFSLHLSPGNINLTWGQTSESKPPPEVYPNSIAEFGGKEGGKSSAARPILPHTWCWSTYTEFVPSTSCGFCWAPITPLLQSAFQDNDNHSFLLKNQKGRSNWGFYTESQPKGHRRNAQLILLTFLWLFRTEGVTKALSHRSHLYFLCPSCTTWIWTFNVSFLLKVASQWSHLKVLSPREKNRFSWTIILFKKKKVKVYVYRET